MRVSRADSTAWTSTVEHVHTTGFRWSCSSSATYCGVGERDGTQVRLCSRATASRRSRGRQGPGRAESPTLRHSDHSWLRSGSDCQSGGGGARPQGDGIRRKRGKAQDMLDSTRPPRATCWVGGRTGRGWAAVALPLLETRAALAPHSTQAGKAGETGHTAAFLEIRKLRYRKLVT